MEKEIFTKNKTGALEFITSETFSSYAFIPNDLPPKNWVMPDSMWPLLLNASKELARLDGVGMTLPNRHVLLRPLKYREAQKSSSIEGTIASPEQLALFELDPTDGNLSEQSRNNAMEVLNYLSASNYWDEKKGELPISLRLIKILHSILMEDVRGSNKSPGEIRRVPVKIDSDARYVPPPVDKLADLLAAYEKFVNQQDNIDPLIKAFMAHYQFEAIHPFRDGNGRVGRLLLAIMIQDWNQHSSQWLYMSSYFDQYRDEYVDRLLRISTHGDWNGWIKFCLKGVIEQAIDTRNRCQKLLDIREGYRDQITQKNLSSRLFGIIENLFDVPVTTAKMVTKEFRVSHPTAMKDLDTLCSIGIVKEIQLSKRNQKGYLSEEILNAIYS